MAERFKLIPEVCLILRKGDEVLLLRRQNTGWKDGWYCTPAGHVEEGESVREAASREAFEEVGVTVLPDDLEFVHVQHRWSTDMGGHSRVGFYFVTRVYEGEPENKEPEKCDEIGYFPLGNLPQNMVEPFRHALECYHQSIAYSEYGWEEKAQNAIE